jgi:hypothetical protein
MSSTTNASKDSVFSRMFGVAQKLGKSLILPVSVLPVACILLGVRGALVNAQNNLPASLFFEIMANSGDRRPAVARHRRRPRPHQNVACRAGATVGYLVLNGTTNVSARLGLWSRRAP